MTDARVILAARNNADWYAMMFELHGLRYHRAENAFLAIDPPPPYHSWMTTLDPAADQAHLEMISRNRFRPGFGVKDSFHRLELSARGLVELFSATWIWAGTVAPANTTGWQRITSRQALALWEAASGRSRRTWAGRPAPRLASTVRHRTDARQPRRPDWCATWPVHGRSRGPRR